MLKQYTNVPSVPRTLTPNKESLVTSQLSWQVVGTDLFEINGTRYLLTVEYFSQYPEVTKLTES